MAPQDGLQYALIRTRTLLTRMCELLNTCGNLVTLAALPVGLLNNTLEKRSKGREKVFAT